MRSRHDDDDKWAMNVFPLLVHFEQLYLSLRDDYETSANMSLTWEEESSVVWYGGWVFDSSFDDMLRELYPRAKRGLETDVRETLGWGARESHDSNGKCMMEPATSSCSHAGVDACERVPFPTYGGNCVCAKACGYAKLKGSSWCERTIQCGRGGEQMHKFIREVSIPGLHEIYSRHADLQVQLRLKQSPRYLILPFPLQSCPDGYRPVTDWRTCSSAVVIGHDTRDEPQPLSSYSAKWNRGGDEENCLADWPSAGCFVGTDTQKRFSTCNDGRPLTTFGKDRICQKNPSLLLL